MKYTTEIFETLSRGKFISSNSLDKAQRNWYDDIDDNYQEYFDFFIKIGYKLERGNGYCFFTRQMAKVDIESKIKSLMKWIDYLAFLNIELKNMIGRMFKGKSSNEDKIDSLINELLKEGFIEIENEIESRYKVLSSFNYIEEIIQKIDIEEESENEEFK